MNNSNILGALLKAENVDMEAFFRCVAGRPMGLAGGFEFLMARAREGISRKLALENESQERMRRLELMALTESDSRITNANELSHK